MWMPKFQFPWYCDHSKFRNTMLLSSIKTNDNYLYMYIHIKYKLYVSYVENKIFNLIWFEMWFIYEYLINWKSWLGTVNWIVCHRRFKLIFRRSTKNFDGKLSNLLCLIMIPNGICVGHSLRQNLQHRGSTLLDSHDRFIDGTEWDLPSFSNWNIYNLYF